MVVIGQSTPLCLQFLIQQIGTSSAVTAGGTVPIGKHIGISIVPVLFKVDGGGPTTTLSNDREWSGRPETGFKLKLFLDIYTLLESTQYLTGLKL
jgi:hypothetical protein